MSKLTNIWESYKAYRGKIWVPVPDTEGTKPVYKTVRDDPEYFKRYYNDHKEKIREYAREYYRNNKEKLYNNRLTKNQELVYNYCIQEKSPDWVIPSILEIAEKLWMQPFSVYRSLQALINKWKLYDNGEEIYTEKNHSNIYITDGECWTYISDDYKERGLDEGVSIKEENKILKDENAILQRKLENAEDRYMKLLGEYTEYKEKVQKAYIDLEEEGKNFNHAIGTLDFIIMNR